MSRARILADYVSSGVTAAEFDYMDGVTSNVQTQIDTAGGFARNDGLIVKYVSATTVDIDADFLTVFDSSSVGTVLSSINLTAAITASGVNGLDTGSEADVWYHIWVIYNGTTIASLLSASATAPTMPSGYTYKKYVGAVKNTSGDFVKFYQRGNDISLQDASQYHRIVSNGTGAKFTSLSFANSVPPNADVVRGFEGGSCSSNVRFIMWIAEDNADGGMGAYMYDSAGLSRGGSQAFEMNIKETQTFYYGLLVDGGGTGDVDVYITGYKFSGIV